jgi:2-iminobutanoate/2-iminopropanoate deaminase
VPQEPEVERHEHQDGADVGRQPFPEVPSEEQNVHPDHESRHRDEVQGADCRLSHRAIVPGRSLGSERALLASHPVAKEIISTSDAPGGFAGYSQAIRANGLVFVSGQGPLDPATGGVVGDTIQEQTRQCLRNVEAVLKAAGSTMDDIVQATFILLDESDFSGMNEEWNRWFPTDPPARQGAKLPVSPKGMRISIAAIAAS